MDTLLRKRDELDRDLIGKLLPDFEQCPQRGEFRIADVDVAADEEDAVGDLPAEDLGDAALHIVDRQVLDPLAPDRDALEERAAEVVPRLSDREHGVEMNVRP